jgi:nitrate/TMAO reductase-like tetraheme cytochrome c subunit
MWTQANRGSTDMNPGRACITCHSTMNGPSLTIAGTVYPTAHEPDLCNGANGSNGARVVITGADGATLTLTPGTSGNFNSRTAVKTPFRAKVTYMGRERAMSTAQTSGDCNSCHTQSGTNSAPGRILLP